MYKSVRMLLLDSAAYWGNWSVKNIRRSIDWYNMEPYSPCCKEFSDKDLEMAIEDAILAAHRANLFLNN